jgi:thioredoxin reductase (NADPH)
VPGEDRLRGHGVSHCASCDAPLLAGGVAAVVGGGDSALQEALTVADHAARTVVLHRGQRLDAQAVYRSRAELHPTIDIRLGATVEAIEGEGAVAGVRLADDDVLELAGVFVYVGTEPETSLVPPDVRCDDDGRVVTDVTLATGVPGLFAAGDVRSGSSGQAVSAAGDGAAAAMAAHRYLASLD